MRAVTLPLTVVFAVALSLSIVLGAVLVAIGVSVGIALTSAGIALPLLLTAGLEARQLSGQRRRVWVIDYREHDFGHAVERGVRRVLQDEDKNIWEVKTYRPEVRSESSSSQWQIGHIQRACAQGVEGLIVIPVADDAPLWNALAEAMTKGVFVVVLDTKPPNKVFQRVGVQPPRFVSSDYSETGVLVGGLLVEWLNADPQRWCVLWLGPRGSWPGEERSRNILLRLAYEGLLDRAQLCPIHSWAPDQRRRLKTIELVQEIEGEVAVYCADDENARELVERLPENLRRKMYVIGCNGMPNARGRVDVCDSGAVNVTIDILAEQQGDRAAQLFINERNGSLDPSDRPDPVTPQLLHSAVHLGDEEGARPATP